MSKVLIPSSGPDSWKQFLAKPELHWAKGFSARTLAYAWEDANGIPTEISDLLLPVVGEVKPLVVIPEHKTPLPGGRRESQSDVFLLARHSAGIIACTIEGKVDEPFGPTVAKQMVAPSTGQQERFDYLCARLNIRDCPATTHYQLLHRTVAALIEAERFCASDAAMIVHSFSPERRWFDAFAAFVELLGGGAPIAGEPVVIGGLDRRLILGWVCGQDKFREM